MDKQALREQLNALIKELKTNEEEHTYLVGSVQNLEGLLRVRGWANGVKADPTPKKPGRGGAPKGTIGFRKGFEKVMQSAIGEYLEDTLIWMRMQDIGVVSEAKNPLSFVNMRAKATDEVEAKGEEKIYRWINK